MCKGVTNNFERLKRDIQEYTIKEFAEFLMLCGHRGPDWYTDKVCESCRKQNNGCPTKGNGCVYGDDYLTDVIKYLEMEALVNDKL